MKRILTACVLACVSLCLGAQQIDWSRVEMDGSRTGCSIPGKDNSDAALGTVSGKVYKAPNGKVYKGASVAKVAAALLEAQPVMADVKQVVGYSEKGMWSRGGNSPLANFATDALIAESESVFGRKADVAILNSGGIRASVEAGAVLKDDIMAIFPFKNYYCMLEYPGKVLLKKLKRMAKYHVQPISGVDLVIKDRELVSATIGGREIDPEETYLIVTIDFLLGSGDNMHLADGATAIQRTQTLVFDVIMSYINSLTAAGKSLDCEVDNRVIYKK